MKFTKNIQSKKFSNIKKIIIVLLIIILFLAILLPIYFIVIKPSKKNILYNSLRKTTPIKGYYLMSWKSATAPAGDWDFGVWFGGETPLIAIDNNIRLAKKITTGKKILDLGGGIETGIWNKTSDLDYVISRLSDIKAANWDGLCFDVEVCTANINFIDAFKKCFASCKASGLLVIVTTSGIKPYACTTGSGQGSDLMNAWILDPNIDYISPQLYGGDGKTLETQSLSLFKDIQQKILPSIPYDSDWDRLTMDNININPGGYIIWNVTSGTPKTNTNFCGNRWDNVDCSKPCVNGVDSDCSDGNKCFADVTSCGNPPKTNTKFCGNKWDNVDCSKPCVNGVDADCSDGNKCFADVTYCGKPSQTI